MNLFLTRTSRFLVKGVMRYLERVGPLVSDVGTNTLGNGKKKLGFKIYENGPKNWCQFSRICRVSQTFKTKFLVQIIISLPIINQRKRFTDQNLSRLMLRSIIRRAFCDPPSTLIDLVAF